MGRKLLRYEGNMGKDGKISSSGGRRMPKDLFHQQKRIKMAVVLLKCSGSYC